MAPISFITIPMVLLFTIIFLGERVAFFKAEVAKLLSRLWIKFLERDHRRRRYWGNTQYVAICSQKFMLSIHT